MTIFREIIKELFYEKTRTILIIIAIACSTFTIAIMLAVGEGLRLNFMRTMTAAGTKLLTITPGITTKNYRGVHANETFRFTERDVEAIATLPNVVSIVAQYDFVADIRYHTQRVHMYVRAVPPEYAPINNIGVGPKQRFFSHLDMKKRGKVIVLGSETVDKLFTAKDDPIGRTIYVNNHPFVIIGVVQKKPRMGTGGLPHDFLNWIPTTTYKSLYNPQQIDLITVSYQDQQKLPQTKIEIQKILVLGHNIEPNDAGIVDFYDISEKQQKVDSFFINMQVFLGIVGGLTLLLAGVGIVNVMYVAIRRTTKQIGVRMALGATTKHILSRYIFESLLATSIGGIIGIMMAILFVYLVRLIPMTSVMFNVIGKPEPVLSPLVLIITIMALGVMGLVAGLLPAIKAIKIDPAEALIYE